MIECKQMLMIGATGRNQGKTELSCQIIKKFSSTNDIIGLKVSTHYPNDFKFHGKNEKQLKDDYEICKHYEKTGDTNTARMLNAGAKEAYRIRAYEEHLEKAISDFFAQINPKNLIVCESNSLRAYVKPAVFIMIKNNSSLVSNKFSSEKVFNFADLFVIFDGNNLEPCLGDICTENNQWKIKI